MAADMKIWESTENQIFLNPALPVATHDLLRETFNEVCRAHSLKSHIGILSSGTTSTGLGKILFLSKSAFLAAARGSNDWLSASSKDRWLASIPIFHVGGLSIYARAYLSESVVIEGPHKWNPQEFCKQIEEYQVTLTSLVPTQVFDLVRDEFRAPHCLRAIIVGGAALNPLIYEKARALGWPLLPSFGATEACSQIATASLESLREKTFPALELLPHIQARLSVDEHLEIASPSLFTGYYDVEKKAWLPRTSDFYTLEDFVALEGRTLTPQGRGQDFVKILGEGVQLSRLEQELYKSLFEKKFFTAWTLVAVPEVRKGFDLVLVTTENSQIALQALQEWNSSRPAYERIARLEILPELPQTALGKIQKAKILEQISNRYS